MASFDFFTCRIDVSNRGSSLDLDAMPGHAVMTMSFCHEYVHFLQLLSSNAGFRILGELVDFGVHAALMLAKVIPPDGIVVGYHEILPKLAALPDGEGAKHDAIRQRACEFMDEAGLLFGIEDFPYTGSKGAWEVVQQEVVHGTFKEVMAGFVSPSGRFRPFTPGLLAEGMARRIDQWLKLNMGYVGHSWSASVYETEFYNGLRNILSQPRYEHNVVPTTIDRITVMLCSLALSSHRPDHAAFRMLQRLESSVTAGVLAQAVGDELRQVVIAEGLLHADHFNTVMDGIMHGPARAMSRVEYYGIHEQLGRIRTAANRALRDPGYLADETMNWDKLRAHMATYSVPPVRASDGNVAAVKGMTCVSNVTDFLQLVHRKLF